MRVIEVKVRPGARDSRLQQEADGSWTAHLKSPPVDGRANAELIALVAAHLGVRRAAVTLKSGAASRLKRLVVED